MFHSASTSASAPHGKESCTSGAIAASGIFSIIPTLTLTLIPTLIMYKRVFIITEDLCRWLTGPFALGPNNPILIEDNCDAYQMLEGTWIPWYYVRTGILLYYWITTYHSIRLLTIVLFISSPVDEINCRAFTPNTSSHSECQFSLEIQNTYLNYNQNGNNDGNFLRRRGADRSGREISGGTRVMCDASVAETLDKL